MIINESYAKLLKKEAKEQNKGSKIIIFGID
jgi:hypothetical protein